MGLTNSPLTRRTGVTSATTVCSFTHQTEKLPVWHLAGVASTVNQLFWIEHQPLGRILLLNGHQDNTDKDTVIPQ